MHDILSLLALIAIGVSWLVPNHYVPWTSFYNELCMALGLGLLLAGALARRRALEWPATAWVLVAVAAIPWLQWLSGALWYLGDAWVGSLYVIGFAVAVAVGATWARIDAPKFAARLSVATVAACIVSAVVGMWQVLDLGTLGLWAGEGGAGMRAEANLAQPNNLATLLGFGVLGTLMLFEARKFGALTACMLLGVQLFGMALTQSRAALLFGPAIAVVLMWARWRGIATRTGPLAVWVGTAIHWAATWLWPAAQGALGQETSLTLVQRGAGSIRFLVWPMLLDAVSNSPWGGFGWLQVAAAQLSTAVRHPPAGELWAHGHNLFLELVVWCGIPVGLALSGLVVWWFVSRMATLATVEALVGMLIVSVLGLHSMVELPYHFAYFLIPMGLWMGVVEAQRGSPTRGHRFAGTAVAALAAVMTVALCIGYLDIEEDFRRVRFEGRRIGTPIAVDSVAQSPVLSSLTGFLRFARTEPRPGMSAAEIAAMEAATRRNPYVASLTRDAEALALNGRLTDALQRFLAIRHIHGERLYQQARRDLRETITEGHRDLQVLESSLPP